MADTGLILVAGGTGKQGGAVARHLLNLRRPIRALTRDPTRATHLADYGAEVVRGDMTDRRSLDRALEGVWGVYAMTTFFEGGIDEEIEQGKTLAEAARDAGVERYVYSSVIGATDGTGIPHIDSKGVVEDRIRELGLRATMLRPVSFMENFLAHWMWPFIRDGKLPLGLKPETRFQMVAVDDIGAYGSSAFLRPDDFTGAAIPLASDEKTGDELAAAWSRKLGRPVEFEPLPLDQLEQIFAPALGEDFARDFAKMFRWFNSGAQPRVDIAANQSRWGIRTTSFDAWLDGMERLEEKP
ncbi:MAG: NmrA/HSCARG family protein [Gemmatimonadota bacterium]